MKSTWISGILLVVSGCTGGETGAGTGDGGGATGAGGSGGIAVVRGNGGAVVAVGTGGRATGGVTGMSGTGGRATGGVTGTGGSPVTVTLCDASNRKVDVWENITFTEIAKDGPQAVVVDPSNPSTVFVGGNKVGIWKSFDCGATWAKVNTGNLASDIDSGANWNIQIDPNDGTLYTIVGYGTNRAYKSTNGGVDWVDLMPNGSTVLEVAGFAQEMSLDPSNPKHIAMSFHEDCASPYPPSCLAESTDGGTTWGFIPGPASGWVEGASPIILGGAHWLLSTGQGVWQTVDSGKAWSKVADWGSHQAYHAPDGTWFLGSNDVLMSKDGTTWSHIPNSWRNVAMAGDGVRVFGSDQWPNGARPYHAALLTDPLKWTTMDSPTMNDGGDHLVYDAVHSLLYSTNHAGGLWRMRTQ